MQLSSAVTSNNNSIDSTTDLSGTNPNKNQPKVYKLHEYWCIAQWFVTNSNALLEIDNADS